MSVIPLPLRHQAFIRVAARTMIAESRERTRQAETENAAATQCTRARISDSRRAIRIADHALQAGKLWGV
jgi:hypothetical protein